MPINLGVIICKWRTKMDDFIIKFILFVSTLELSYIVGMKIIYNNYISVKWKRRLKQLFNVLNLNCYFNKKI